MFRYKREIEKFLAQQRQPLMALMPPLQVFAAHLMIFLMDRNVNKMRTYPAPLSFFPINVTHLAFPVLSEAAGETIYESLAVNGTLTIPVTTGVRGGGQLGVPGGNLHRWQIHYSWFTVGL